MLNFQMGLPRDLREVAKIERKKQYEEQRKPRIFNARNRLIGIDVEGLEKQIKEKKIREEDEKSKDEAFRLKLMRDSEIGNLLEKQITETQNESFLNTLNRLAASLSWSICLEVNRRKINEEINEFRAVYQRTEDRREFDLYDPDSLKKSLPCRLLDDDPRLGLSSAQKFEGEDMTAAARKIAQTEQQKSWLTQQIAERRMAENDRLEAEKRYQEAVIARDQRAVALDKMEMECRRSLKEATSRFNQALAAERETEHKMREMRELEDKQAEIYNAVTSDFLTENPDMSKSNLGSGRLTACAFKGATPEQKDEWRLALLKQIEEKKTKLEAEAKRQAQWDELANGMAKSVALTERELMRKQRDIDRQLLDQNKELRDEQRAYRDYTDRVLYTNVPTAYFYEQFNKSTR